MVEGRDSTGTNVCVFVCWMTLVVCGRSCGGIKERKVCLWCGKSWCVCAEKKKGIFVMEKRKVILFLVEKRLGLLME